MCNKHNFLNMEHTHSEPKGRIIMDNFEADLLTLTDEDGVEMEFQILDSIDHEGNRYLALLPTEEADDEDENGSYYILREEESSI